MSVGPYTQHWPAEPVERCDGSGCLLHSEGLSRSREAPIPARVFPAGGDGPMAGKDVTCRFCSGRLCSGI